MGPVWRRPVSRAELQRAGSGFARRSPRLGLRLTLTTANRRLRCSQVVGDAVAAPGNGPCHIQAVEPSGPAAGAGLKVGVMGRAAPGPSGRRLRTWFWSSGLQVRQFLVSVNVLSLDYRRLSHMILRGPRTVVMEVMEETQH